MAMDATHHLASYPRYQDYQGSTSRPSISRSQTTGTTGPNEIDFSIPDVRPGLARIGRRLTEMSENFLYDDAKSPDSETKRTSTTAKSMDTTPKVPFMGDEPVFCPFCDKPLPPALLLQHMATAAQEADTKANPRLAGVESSGMAKTTSAPEGFTKSATPPPPLPPTVKPHLHKQPSGIAASRPTSPISAAQLATNVNEADSVDSAAGKLLLDTETLRKWAKIAGVELDLPPPPEAPTTNTQKDVPIAKPFPKLAPPPEDSSRSSSRNSSRFSLFGKGKAKQDEDEEDESDDDLSGAGGYARLDAPASPERVENELPSLKKRSAEGEETPAGGDQPKEAEEEPASDAEVRELLKEVLTKINEVSKSHASVLHSHSTLLTTLKIARSNLAMAEANAEMLEEQLKRQTTQTVKPSTASTAPPRPQSSTAMAPPPNPKPAPIRTATTGPGAGEGQIAKTEPVTPRRSVESSRPQSIQIPSSTNPRTPISASSDSSKGMFGSFWNRNKDKVGEFMSNLPDLTPTAERSSFDFAKSPTSSAVPYGAAIPDYRSSPGLNRSKTVHGRAGESDSMARSSSYTNVQAAGAASGSQAPMDPYARELSRLRQLHQTSQQKIEAMTKELAEMKKGKIEMEAELENLSQALFEEANKMVADEKKKRVEMEEALKEVKAEREALRDTIKVLGGQVESESSKGDPDEVRDEVAGELPDFAPRDLDKHYEALRKSIHHVADDTEWNKEDREGKEEEEREGQKTDQAQDEAPTTPVKARRHSLPDIASPEPQKAPTLHDPWADSDTPANVSSSSTGLRGSSTSPNRARLQLKPLTAPSDEIGPTDASTVSEPKSDSGSRRSSVGGPVSPKAEKLDALDEMMEKMQADIELESPKAQKKNPL